MINARYKDCVAIEKWFSETSTIEGETSWELYKRYDPLGSRAMNQGSFYSLLSRSWRDQHSYRYINQPHSECVAAATWCSTQSLPAEGTDIEKLMKLYDPVSSVNWRMLEFFDLLPNEWRKRVKL